MNPVMNRGGCLVFLMLREFNADMETVAIIQIVLLAIIALLMVVIVVIINGLAKSLKECTSRLEQKLLPAIDNVKTAAGNLIPVIDSINGRNDQICYILEKLPGTIDNYRELSENLKPLSEEIKNQTPQIRESLHQLSSAAVNLKAQTDELTLRFAPAASRISGVVQAFTEGFKIFKAFTKRN
jgi:methyl-accepting chemotaxis protein